MDEHRCEPPLLPVTGTVRWVVPWTCGDCGRVFVCQPGAGGGAWWLEARGPRFEQLVARYDAMRKWYS